MTAQLAVTFPQGDLVRLSVTFTRRPTDEEVADGTACSADDWQLADPDTVSAKVGLWDPDTKAVDPDTVTLHDWLGSPADIVRDSIGAFHLDFTPDEPGKWYFEFDSNGAVQAVAWHWFFVNASPFP